MLDELLQRRPYNAAADFVDGAIELGFSKKIAFIDTNQSLTYLDLQTYTRQFADGLKKMDVRQEERVALLLYDTIEFPIAFWGCIRAGVVALPLNTFLTTEQYVYILSDSRATTIVLAASLAKILLPSVEKLPFLRTIIIVDAEPEYLKVNEKIIDFNEFLATGKNIDYFAPTLSDEVAFWMYTSGTTREPKAVKHVHTTLMAAARLMGQEVLGIQENDIIFSAAKLFFSYGLGSAGVFPLLVGATTILLPEQVTPERVFHIFTSYQPTLFFGVPALYAKLLLDEKEAKKIQGSSLRIAVSAGECLPEKLAIHWKKITGVDVLDGLGSTEMFHTFLSNRPSDVCYGTMGKAVPGYELKIVDEDGFLVSENEMGELMVCGPTAGEGYWNQRLKTQYTFVGEWVHTGDRCFRDQEGYYHYVGRVDDMFKVNGLWLSPFEIEAALVSHEAVREAAIIGKADENGLLKPKAFVVLQVGYILDESLQDTLKMHVKKSVGSWKYPRWIEACENLPRTASGKLRRACLS